MQCLTFFVLCLLYERYVLPSNYVMGLLFYLVVVILYRMLFFSFGRAALFFVDTYLSLWDECSQNKQLNCRKIISMQSIKHHA